MNKSLEVEQTEIKDIPIPKLMLGVITSPRDAFEEITRRKLLGVALMMPAVFGLMLVADIMTNPLFRNTGMLFGLATKNPVAALALLLILSFVAYQGSRLVMGEGTFLDTLMMIGWTFLPVVISLLIGLIRPLNVLSQAVFMWALVVAMIGLAQVQKITVLKSAGVIILSLIGTFAMYGLLTSHFLTTVYTQTAAEVPSMAAVVIPGAVLGAWLLAIALVIAAVFIPRLLDENVRRLYVAVFAATAVAGVAIAVVATGCAVKLDLVGGVIRGARFYMSVGAPDPAAAVRHFDKDLDYFPSDYPVRLYRGHALAASGDYDEALKDYDKIRKSLNVNIHPDSKNMLAVVETGTGSVRYYQGDYKAAGKKFDEAAELWAGYYEPVARKSLVELRLGREKEALDTANKAIKAGYDGVMPHVVLAQIHTKQGDKKKAEAAIKSVTDMNRELAKKLSSAPGGWGSAVENLTRMDLRMPITAPRIVRERDRTRNK